MAAQPHESDSDDSEALPEFIPAETRSDRALRDARRYRAQLLKRLEDEEADDLADKLRGCGEPFKLVCTDCGVIHQVERRCRKKWCPVCARAIAAARCAKYEAGVRQMKWPLHVTLTVQNAEDLSTDFVRELRTDFGKLRRRVIWDRQVAGGVAGMEVTNRGKGWHPHIHALIDCEWLAVKTPKPKPGMSRDKIKRLCKAAQREMAGKWAEVVGQDSAVIWIRRVPVSDDPEVLAGEIREVLKYSAKGSDLVKCAEEVAPLIRLLDSTRLTTSFGTLYGKLKDATPPKNPMPCDGCGHTGTMIPQDMIDRMIRIVRETRPRI